MKAYDVRNTYVQLVIAIQILDTFYWLFVVATKYYNSCQQIQNLESSPVAP